MVPLLLLNPGLDYRRLVRKARWFDGDHCVERLQLLELVQRLGVVLRDRAEAVRFLAEGGASGRLALRGIAGTGAVRSLGKAGHLRASLKDSGRRLSLLYAAAVLPLVHGSDRLQLKVTWFRGLLVFWEVAWLAPVDGPCGLQGSLAFELSHVVAHYERRYQVLLRGVYLGELLDVTAIIGSFGLAFGD